MSFTLDEARNCARTHQDLADLNRLYPYRKDISRAPYTEPAELAEAPEEQRAAHKARCVFNNKARWKVLSEQIQQDVDQRRIERFNVANSSKGAPAPQYTYSTNWFNVAALVAAVAIAVGTIALVASVALSLGAIGITVGVGLLLAGCAVDGYYAYSFMTDKNFSCLS